MWASNNSEKEKPWKKAVVLTADEKDDDNELLLYESSPPELRRIPTKCGLTAVHIYNANNNNNIEGGGRGTAAAAAAATTATTNTVILLHGFGGRKEEFRDGRLAQKLATKYRVIAFDWYGHGESPDCCANSSNSGNDDDGGGNGGDDDNKNENKNKNDYYCDYYKKKSFLEQLQVIVSVLMKETNHDNNSDSNTSNNTAKKFHLYAFSMGNFLALHYFRSFPENVDKLVLHSPWNGEVGYPLDPTNSKVLASMIRLPFGVGLTGADVIRKLYFPYVHDASTFRKIFLSIGDGQKAWDQLLDDVANLIITRSGNSTTTATGSCSTINEDKKRVLIICGEAERPFFTLAKYISEQFQKKENARRPTTTSNNRKKSSSSPSSSSSLVHFVSYPGASHTTWRDDWDKPAGRFFRNHIYHFLTDGQH